MVCVREQPGGQVAQPLASRDLAISTEVVEYQSPMSDQASVPLEPIRLLPPVEGVEHVAASAQLCLDPDPCADEPLDTDCGCELASLVEVEVLPAKQARDVQDAGHPPSARWSDDEVTCCVHQPVLGTKRLPRERSELFAAVGEEFAIERTPAEQPRVEVDLDPVGGIEGPSVEEHRVEWRWLVAVSVCDEDLDRAIQILWADRKIDIARVAKVTVRVVQFGCRKPFEHSGLDRSIIEEFQDACCC